MNYQENLKSSILERALNLDKYNKDMEGHLIENFISGNSDLESMRHLLKLYKETTEILSKIEDYKINFGEDETINELESHYKGGREVAETAFMHIFKTHPDIVEKNEDKERQN
jgi:hypothetical protein